MLSYMLPASEDPQPSLVDQQQRPQHQTRNGYHSHIRTSRSSGMLSQHQQQPQHRVPRATSFTMFTRSDSRQGSRPGSATPLLQPAASPDHVDCSPMKLNGCGNGSTVTSHRVQAHSCHVKSSPNTTTGSIGSTGTSPGVCIAVSAMKSTSCHNKEAESPHSTVDSDAASNAGSERKAKAAINGPKHANLKRVSFGSSKGSMVETLVYETPVQEEPESNHFSEHNGRLPQPMISVPDTDEGREKVRVSLLGAKPFPSTPGVLLLDPPPLDIMAVSPAELLTAHTDHTIPTYHTQISTDSGWDNPFRPDGDLSREADEIVELIKGGKPITPTPGQNAPSLPGCEPKVDLSTSPLLQSSASPTSTRQAHNGNAHSTPNKPSGGAPNEKGTATVDVGRVTSQGPGDASQVEHVTLKKKPKCKCCVLQ